MRVHVGDVKLPECNIEVKLTRLILWSVGAFSTAAFFGFSGGRSVTFIAKQLSTAAPAAPPEWMGWEVGALIWTAIVTFAFYFSVPLFRNKAGRIIDAIIFCGVGYYLYRAFISLLKSDSVAHITSVVVVLSIFAAVDWYIMKFHHGADERQNFRDTFWHVDLPILIPATFLLVFVHRDPNITGLDGFVSGVIAFQFLVSNVLFVMTQEKVFRRHALRHLDIVAHTDTVTIRYH